MRETLLELIGDNHEIKVCVRPYWSMGVTKGSPEAVEVLEITESNCNCLNPIWVVKSILDKFIMVVNEVQFKKAKIPMEVTEVPIVTEVRLEQSRKHCMPMVSTELPIITVSRLAHP